MHTIVLLTLSNVFMTIAWYGHLKYKDTPLWTAILVSWGIAFVASRLWNIAFKYRQIGSVTIVSRLLS